ncbi:MAG: phosphate ABC transporter substrate-binding protein [Thermoguttaceae bacterium]
MSGRYWFGVVAGGVCTVALAGCGSSTGGVQMVGSDTMVNVAQAWAEKYNAQHPEAMVQVAGGGSGVGIAKLIDGTCDLANSSRKLEPEEIQRVEAKRGVGPIEHVVGFDALAVYVHKDNPLDSISLEELAEIYGKEGKTDHWSQLGLTSGSLGSDEISRVSRQNSSGTFAYFREAVLGKGRDYKPGMISCSGSKDVVDLVAKTPSAIGYSGMGYATAGVKMLRLSVHKGETALAPTLANAKKQQGGYPITRPLLIYTAGEATGPAKEFLDWIQGKEGQAVLLELGYVPVRDHE